MFQGVVNLIGKCWHVTKKMCGLLLPTDAPDFKEVLPTFVRKKDFLFWKKEVEKDTATGLPSLIPAQAYSQIRQLQSAQSEQSPVLFTPEQHPHLGLKWPAFVGENGRLISVFKDEKRRLGEGNFGKVYWGIDEDSKKQVAVKYQSQLDAQGRKEVRAEIKAMAEFNRLVSSIEIDESTIVIVDEFSPGTPCDKFIKANRSNKDRTVLLQKLQIAIKTLKAFDEKFHRRGYLHRDIKLDNVMWESETQNAKIVDFGSVIKRDVAAGKKLDDHGTNIYQAPEVVLGHYSIATEVFACGVFLIDLLSEHDIFKNEKEWIESRTKLSKHNNSKNRKEFVAYLNKAAVDLLGVKPRPELAPIRGMIKNMISHDPKKRPTSLQPVIAALENQYQALMTKADTALSARSKM